MSAKITQPLSKNTHNTFITITETSTNHLAQVCPLEDKHFCVVEQKLLIRFQ